ncbi:MAG: phosphoribosylanthranilate isomerase [Rhodospirillales bacterium]|nr:phosphoribosylanthranilate isomerase [Rhodospirillales bacterium]
MAIGVKICGLNDNEGLDAARRYGARMVGFNFFLKSPRFVDTEQVRPLAERVGPDVERVGVTVDPDDDLLSRIVPAAKLSIVQFHGNESPERVADVRERYRVRALKVIRISEAADLEPVAYYEHVADFIMFDTKPPKGATRPGGNAVAFDWRLLSGRSWRRPWLLSGGLNPDNLRQAVELTGATFADVASGVESAPGKKDPAMIRAFMDEAAAL